VFRIEQLVIAHPEGPESAVLAAVAVDELVAVGGALAADAELVLVLVLDATVVLDVVFLWLLPHAAIASAATTHATRTNQQRRGRAPPPPLPRMNDGGAVVAVTRNLLIGRRRRPSRNSSAVSSATGPVGRRSSVTVSPSGSSTPDRTGGAANHCRAPTTVSWLAAASIWDDRARTQATRLAGAPGPRLHRVVDVEPTPLDNHQPSLALALRSLRAGRGLSLAEVARATGISSSFLSLVEQGRSDITIGRLIRLAEFYDVQATELLTGGTRPPESPIHVLRADPENVIHSDIEGVDLYGLAGGSRWTLVPVLAVHQPDGEGIAVEDAHEREALVFVLDGIFELALDGHDPLRLRKGEGAVYRSVAPYRLRNTGKRPGRVLVVGVHPH
jgi:transcriptional regulator with XRE-family HTH domain